MSVFMCSVDVGLQVDEEEDREMSPHSHSRSSVRSVRSASSQHLEHPDLGLVGPSGENLLQWEKRCGQCYM
jgi:hypothetical protein